MRSKIIVFVKFALIVLATAILLLISGCKP